MITLRGCMRFAWCVFLAGACVVPLPPVRDTPRNGENPRVLVTERSGAPRSLEKDLEGTHGFVLESTLRARRIRSGQPPMFLELGNGDMVVDGDRLQVVLRTSQEAYLYLAFCSQKAKDPQFPGLQVFPKRGAIYARAYETKVVPDRVAEIVLDDQPGRETLYLILSRTELSNSDSGLAQVLAAARHGSQSADCGPAFQTAVVGSGQQHKPKEARSGNLSGHRSSASSPTATASRTLTARDVEPVPVVEIQRGGDIVWNDGVSMGLEADPDGVVVLRYGLIHVTARP